MWQAVGDVRGRGRLRAAARLAPLAAALMHTGYIVAIGGDFMHARMLLPAVFAIAAPVVVPLRGILPARLPGGRFDLHIQQAGLILAVPLLAVWAVVCAVDFRPHLSSAEARPYPVSDDGISDERVFYRMLWEQQHPVSEADYPYAISAPVAGYADLDISGDGWPDTPVELTSGSDVHAASVAGTIGVLSAIWGTNVYLVDPVSLAHPIGSRLPPQPDTRIGHEKPLPLAWQIAGVPLALRSETMQMEDGTVLVTRAELEAARAAVKCGQLGRYLRDVRAPLTPARFAGNIVDSFANTFLRVPEDPVDAVEQLCDY